MSAKKGLIKMQVIALIGPKSSGKSTLAKAYLDKYRGKVIITSLAEPIKLMLGTFFSYQGEENPDVIYQMLYGDLKEQPTPYLNNQTPRHAMETLGTEWRNLIDRDLWLASWQRKAIHILTKSNKTVIVDDLRFQHEAKAVKNLEGHIIHISREGCLPGLHPSESEYLQIKPDLIIFNTENKPEQMLLQLEQYLERRKL